MGRLLGIIVAFGTLLGGSSIYGASLTLHLDNGDAITGEILSADDTEVVLIVEYLGEIKVPMERIRNSDMVIEAMAAESAEALAKSDEGEVAEEELNEGHGSEHELVASPFPEIWTVRGIAQWVKSIALWEKNVQVGFNDQTGRKELSDFNSRFDMQLQRERDQFRINIEYYYGKTEDLVTKDSFASGFRWRQDIAPGVFYEANTIYSYDEIKLIDSNVEQKLGLGTRLMDTDSTTVSAGLGASGRWRRFQEKDEEVLYLVDLFQDWDYRFSDRLEFRQDLRMAVPWEESDDYEFTFSASLTSSLTNAINLSVRYEVGFDNSLEEDLKEDRRVISALGYAF